MSTASILRAIADLEKYRVECEKFGDWDMAVLLMEDIKELQKELER